MTKRPLSLVFAVTLLLVGGARPATAEIREFDVKTTERLGNELVRVSKQPDRGFDTPAKKLAKENAIGAVRDRAYQQVRYDYVVLDDPAGNGLLVYALALPKGKGAITTGGHYRIGVSADGRIVKRVDLLSQLIEQPKSDAGKSVVAVAIADFEAQRPVETWIFTSDYYRMPIYLATMDKSTWRIVNGKIHKFTRAELEKMDLPAKKK